MIIDLPTYYNRWRPAPTGFAAELASRAVAELGAENVLFFEMGNEPQYCERCSPIACLGGGACRLHGMA